MKKAEAKIFSWLPATFKLALFCVMISGVGAIHAAAEAGIDFNIRFFDRRIYHAANGPIYIQITISNNSPFTYRFKLADDRMFSVDFEVRTVTNRLKEPAEELIRRRTQSRQVFFREIAIEPGESFSFVENLREYVRLEEAGSFVVRAFVYPELFRPDFVTTTVSSDRWFTPPNRNLTGVLASSRLHLNIRPPLVIGPDGLPLAMDVATGAILVRERLPPDEVVEYMIRARQRSQWERFFLYLDLEEMVSRDPVRRRTWVRESAEGRQRMVQQFRQELKSPTTIEAISLIPSDFTIERTEHRGNEGTVTVLKRFQGIHFTEVKRYTYYLQRRDNIWSIVDFTVINLGAE
ncbi:MAG: hypothetical protein FWB78_08365 [Treponema sp.]|nr:hypothetical protein [Treponema sp.]